MICGVDEAGRGPVIGPLVVAGVIVNEEEEKVLNTLGVKDSKLLSPIQRKVLYEEIIKRFRYFAIVVEPKEIDEAVESQTSNLNFLEMTKMAMIINKLEPKKAIIDAPSVNTAKFTQDIKKFLKEDVVIQAEHKADLIYPVVSAASIIAKETREMLIADLRRKFDVDFGSGYPADPKTKDFMEKNYNKAKYSEIIRKSWASYKNIVKGKQKKLGEF